MLGLLMFLFQIIQTLKLCFKLKVKKQNQQKTKASPTQKGNLSQLRKQKQDDFNDLGWKVNTPTVKVLISNSIAPMLLQWKW